ncbi:MAG: DNA polymerase III subunit gamma/tau [Chloroflexota bacterium]
MASQVFYRKWRPQTFAEVVGQEPVAQTLRNALQRSRISHAYLFCGPRGTGKTSTARILAKAVNCLTNGKGEPCNTCAMCQAITEARALDVIEIDAASNTSVDDIRSLREKVNYAPNQARFKVYIIDEVHMLSNSASNALLKTLEEPPAHVIFILATTEVHKILPTIMSRCQRFDFRRLSQADILAKLTDVCQTEGIKIDTEALRLVARSATGSLRDAENLLEQLTTYYGAEIGLAQVQAVLGITGDVRTKELVQHIVDNDIAAGIATIQHVNSDGLDLRQFNRELIEYLRALLLVKTGSAESVDLTPEDITALKTLADKAPLEQILKAIKLFGQLELGFDNYSTLPIELALVDCSLPPETTRERPVKASEEAAAGEEVPHQPRKTVISTPKPKATSTPAPVKTPSESSSQPPTETATSTPTPEPVATVPTPPAETIKEAASEIDRLRLNWKQVIQQAPAEVRKSPALAILRSAGVKPVAIEQDTVILAFRYSSFKEQMEKNENQQVVAKVISAFLGRPCRVRCLLEENHLLKAALKMGAQIIDVEEK